MTRRSALVFMSATFAVAACASTAKLPPEYASAIASTRADQPARLIECPGYAPLPSATRSLKIRVDVVVDDQGVVRHTGFGPQRSGTLHSEASREIGLDSWQDHRSDAKRLAEGCAFTPAVHDGQAVAVRTSVDFEFAGDPIRESLGALDCPEVEHKDAKDQKSRPARCGT